MSLTVGIVERVRAIGRVALLVGGATRALPRHLVVPSGLPIADVAVWLFLLNRVNSN